MRKLARLTRLSKAPQSRPAALASIYPMAVTNRVAKRSEEEARGLPHFSRNTGEFRLTELPDMGPKWKDLPIVPEEERRRSAQEDIKAAFRDEGRNLLELEPYRIVVAWRLVRELARVRGDIEHDERLLEGLAPDRNRIDPWVYPCKWKGPPDKAFSARLAQIMFDAEQMTNGNRVFRGFMGEEPKFYPGLPILPPDVPYSARDPKTYVVHQDYDCMMDPMLKLYVQALEAASDWLNIRGTRHGILGLQGLINESLVRLAFPSRIQIAGCEDLMIEKALSLIVEMGEMGCRRVLKNDVGLSGIEVEGLIHLARQDAVERACGDVEEARALMQMRLEDLASRAREGLDARTEIQAYKQLSIVLGLSKVEPSDANKDFIDIVRKFDMKDIEAEQQRMLPGGD